MSENCLLVRESYIPLPSFPQHTHIPMLELGSGTNLDGNPPKLSPLYKKCRAKVLRLHELFTGLGKNKIRLGWPLLCLTFCIVLVISKQCSYFLLSGRESQYPPPPWHVLRCLCSLPSVLQAAITSTKNVWKSFAYFWRNTRRKTPTGKRKTERRTVNKKGFTIYGCEIPHSLGTDNQELVYLPRCIFLLMP